MNLKYFILIILFQLSCSREQVSITHAENFRPQIISNKTIYEAGETISLEFKTNGEVDAKILLKNAYGSSLIAPELNNNNIVFKVPVNYRKKAGICNWVLIVNGKSVTKGELQILPKSKAKPTLETYFGPRSITAGISDYSMLVCVTTDIYDNVFPEGTAVLFRSQFLNTISENTISSKDLISWKNIPTTKKAGRILVNTSFKEVTSSELTSIVFPSNAVKFMIKAHRNHNYADGNQIIKFQTDVILDKYKNIVSDGTMVNFIVENTHGALLNTVAPTIRGIASASILHPSEKDDWKITAYVTGAAKSNTITAKFKTAIKDYEVIFSESNRSITIGPLTSFMQQLIPDGILIQLEIYNKSGKHLETKKVSSIKGFGHINLEKEYHPNGDYHLKLKAAGIHKEFDLTLDE